MALILAGGRSSRFGSDKALARFRGEPLVARAVRLSLERFARVAVVAKTPALYAALVPGAVALVPDADAHASPLSGLAAGLAWGGDAWAFAVDMPFAAESPLAEALLAALLAALGDAPAAAATLDGVVQPLAAVYRGSCATLAARLAAAGAGPRALLDAVGARLVDVTGGPLVRALLDADTPEALAALEHLKGSP